TARERRTCTWCFPWWRSACSAIVIFLVAAGGAALPPRQGLDLLTLVGAAIATSGTAATGLRVGFVGKNQKFFQAQHFVAIGVEASKALAVETSGVGFFLGQALAAVFIQLLE